MAVVLVLLTHNAAGQQLVFHEGFESPQLSPNGAVHLFLDGVSFGGTLSGWGVNSSDPEQGATALVNGNTDIFGVAPQEGQQFVIFNNGDRPPTTHLFRDFATTIGQTYQVSYLIGKGGAGNGAVGLRAEIYEIQGSPGAIFQSDTLVNSIGWVARDFSFIAGTATTRIQFSDISQTTITTDALLDSVSVSAVPEPTTTIFASSIGLFVFGLARKWQNHRKIL